MNDNRDRAPSVEEPPTAFDPIDAALRQIFDKVSDEEVPDDFSALVARFAEQKRNEGGE